jgi:hypothetical protein
MSCRIILIISRLSIFVEYIVRGRFLDNPMATPKDIVDLWEKVIHPSHEILEKMVKDKKLRVHAFLVREK